MSDLFNSSNQPESGAEGIPDSGQALSGSSGPSGTDEEYDDRPTIAVDRAKFRQPSAPGNGPAAQRVQVRAVSPGQGAPRQNSIPVDAQRQGFAPQGAPLQGSSEKPFVTRQTPADQEFVTPQPEQQAPPKPLSNDEVTARTAALWKYLPIPQDEPEPYPEYLNHAVSFPGCNIIAARVRGKKHKNDGTNCDDWYEYSNLGNITFIAVSDGAGSKKLSRIGAKESCKAVTIYLRKAFAKLFTENPALKKTVALPLTDQRAMDACGLFAQIVQQSVICAYKAVESAYEARRDSPAYAKLLGREPEFRDFSGTLLVAVLIPVSKSTKEHLVITCQIGDGMIAVINSKGEFSDSLRLLGVPDSGEYAGQTDFLTSEKMKTVEELQKRTKICRTMVDTVMLMSDGVADDYFPNETQMRRLYYDMIINGIIDGGVRDISMSRIPPAQLSLYRKVPDAMVYPWVNDQNIKVAIQYTNRIMEATGLTLEDIWKDRTILAMVRRELAKGEKVSDPSKRLLEWLDNYYERGSFDDRTLVLVTI